MFIWTLPRLDGDVETLNNRIIYQVFDRIIIRVQVQTLELITFDSIKLYFSIYY